MKVIILSAGIGSRLNPITNTTPKSMLLIENNMSVLERTIKIINEIIDTEIIVVGGFCKNQLEGVVKKYNNCKLIYNPFYKVTNNIASLWFAKDEMDDDLLIINGDVIVEKELLRKTISLQEDALILYDSSRQLYADYKIYEKNNEVVTMGKELREFSGECLGIVKFNLTETNKFKTKIEKMIDNGFYNEWFETALLDMIYTENFKLKAVDVSEYKWTEIDNINDLIRAKEIFNLE